MIPMFAVVHVKPGFRIWIPLVLAYLILLPVLLLLSPFILIACLIFLINPFRMAGVLWGILAAVSGTCINVEDSFHKIYIRII